MEHEIEKKIREKILQAEEQPVRWNRDDVWNKMNPGKAKRKIPFIWYYAAASVLLLASVVVFTADQRSERKNALAIRSLELAIEQLRAGENTTSPKVIVAEQACEPTEPQPNLISHHKVQSTTKEKTIVLVPVVKNESTIVAVDDNQLVNNQTTQISVNDSIENTAPQQSKTIVTTIIIPPPDEVHVKTTKVARNKKLRFNFLRPDKGGSEDSKAEESEILVARIN